MTKEELIKYIKEEVVFGDEIHEAVLLSKLEELYEQNVVIPKGENRHPQADVLHKWIEGHVECVFKYPYGSHRGIAKHIFTEYSDFKIEEFKPLKPVYEWQWYRYSEEEGKAFLTNEFYTEKEASFELRKGHKKIEETKRERKQ